MNESEILLTLLTLSARSFGLLCLLPFPSLLVQRSSLALALALLAYLGLPRLGECSLSALPMEFLIGFLISLPFLLVLQVVAHLAEFFEVQRGQNLGATLDPLLHTQEAYFTVLSKALVWATMLASGIGEVLVGTFINSVEALPCGSGTVAALDVLGMVVCQLTLGAFAFSLSAFLPLGGFLLMLDVGFAFVAKIVPRLSTTSESFQLKSYLGLLIVWGWWKTGLSSELLQFTQHGVAQVLNILRTAVHNGTA